MSAFQLFKGSDPCPICESNDARCKQTGELILCMGLIDSASVPGFHFTRRTKNGQWGLWAPSSEDWSQQQRQQWRDELAAKRKARAEQERRKRAESLSAVERDRHYRAILDSLTLHPEDRADLLRRGLTDEQTEAASFKSVEPRQRLPHAFPKNLPGVAQEGRSLIVAKAGYLCPVRDRRGRIVALQLRVRGATDNKYRWVSSHSAQQLPTGESPLAHYDSGTRPWIVFTEGTGPKPYLASIRLDCQVIGAAGGQFASSPEQVRAAMEAGLTPVLAPDAGAIHNAHVMRQYRRLHELVPELKVRWWGQANKPENEAEKLEFGDVDEVSDERLRNAELLSWDEFWALVPEAIRKRLDASESGVNPKDQIVRKTLWQIKQLFDRSTYKYFKRFGYLPENPQPNPKNEKPEVEPAAKPEAEPECVAIVPYDHNQVSRWELEVTPKTLPSVEYWESVGRPKLVFNPDERIDILIELIKKGYKNIALTDIVGSGKSHATGQLGDNWQTVAKHLAEHLGVDAVKAYFLSNDYRNPTVEGVERIAEVPSGAAIKVDESKQTPLGNPYRRRAKDGETPDIDGLCAHDAVIQSLNEKGVITPRGEDSDYCARCKNFRDCPFLEAMQGVANESALRTDINKLSVNEGETLVTFIDEAGRSLKQHQELRAGLTTLGKEIDALHSADAKFYGDIYPLVRQIEMGLDRAIAECGRFTMNHADVMEFLPSREQLHELLFNTQWEQWQFAKTAWDIPSLWEIAGRMNRGLRPNISELLETAATPGECSDIIKRDLTIGLLPRLIRIIDGRSHEDISISTSRDKDSRVTPTIIVTKPDRKHARAIAKTQSTILMDATPDFIEMAQCLGVKRHEIVQLEAKRPSFKNLTINVVKGLGNVGAIREHYKDGSLVDSPYSQHNRILKAVEAIARQEKERNPEVKLGLLDLKRYVGSYDNLLSLSGAEHVTGYHFRDNRGSNQFKNCDVMLSIGQPRENIGSLLAQWKIKNGQAHTVQTAPEAFWAWVSNKTTHELIQDIGRERAQHRPDTPITHYVLSALSEKQITQLQDYYPGCTIEIVDVYDICPEAADRGTQSTRGIVEALWQQVKEEKKPTLTKAAKRVGLSTSRASQIVKTFCPEGFKALKKSLVRLLEAINSQTKLSELDESLQWLATSYLPTLANQLRSGDDPEAVLEEFVKVGKSVGAAAFRKLLSATPKATLGTLLGAFSSLMAADDRHFLHRMLSRSLEAMVT
ncbi:MAG: hypothetical protein WBA57_18845 [Elainellaceae cyanobacterium]